MNPLLGFQLSDHPAAVVCIAAYIVLSTVAACFFAGKQLYRDDRALKALQREANDVAQLLSKWGFNLLPPILTDFALLDFVKLTADFRHAANVMKNPKTARAELADVLAGMVKEELTDVSTRQAFFDSVYNQAKAAGLKPTTP